MSNNSVRYPTNAAELVADQRFAGSDDFFLLAEVKKDSDGSVMVTVEPDFPILVRSADVRNSIFQETGKKLPTRVEFSKKNLPDNLTVDIGSLTTIGSGAILFIKNGMADSPRIYMVQSDAGKPVAPLTWNLPSGLASHCILETAFSELNQETGILLPSLDGKRLVGMNYRFPPSLGTLSEDFMKSVLAVRETQMSDIQNRISLFYPQHQDKPIEWINVETRSVSEGTDKLKVNMFGQVSQIEAHFLMDQFGSANIHPVLELDISHLSKMGVDTDLSNAVVVDPEEFRRVAGIFSLSQAVALMTEITASNRGITQAPADYLSRKLSL